MQYRIFYLERPPLLHNISWFNGEKTGVLAHYCYIDVGVLYIRRSVLSKSHRLYPAVKGYNLEETLSAWS